MTSAEQAEKKAISIRPMEKKDYPKVSAILQAGMDTGEATFERTAPGSWEEFIEPRVKDLAFVASEEPAAGEDEELLGWVTATQSSHRAVFSGVLEDSIYVSPRAAGKGVAGKLLDHLLQEAGEQGYWSMQSSIFPDNEGSVALHESRGFETAATFHCMAQMEYGPKEGQWRDILVLERILENGPAWEAYQEKRRAEES